MLNLVARRNAHARRVAARGFSLIELMVAVTIMALLLMVGAPELSTYLANSRVRAATESIALGLQAARTEAVRLNRPVQFALVSDAEPTAANVNALTPSTNGTSWVVRRADPLNPDTGTFEFVEAKSGREGSGSGTTPRISVSATQGGTAISTILFRPLGDTNLAAAATISVSHIGQTCTNADGTGGPIRCLAVRVTPGGRAQICDPLAGPGDTRSCG